MIRLDNASTLAQSAADTNGIALTHEALTAAARLASDLTHHSGQLAFDGAAPFRIEAGQVVDVGLVEHIVAVVRELGSPITAPTSTSAASIATPARPSPAARSPRSAGAGGDARRRRDPLIRDRGQSMAVGQAQPHSGNR